MFKLDPTRLHGLLAVHRERIEDSRGFFSRFFCAEQLAHAGFRLPVAQMNHTLTRRKGSIRGMHYQNPPQSEDKLVSCLKGEVFDVAVDLRCDSPTFLHWHAQILSADNATSLLIPQGFAHGFQTLTDDCEMLYVHSRPYAAGSEGALHAMDPALGIDWPLAVTEMSERDARHPHINPEFTGLQV